MNNRLSQALKKVLSYDEELFNELLELHTAIIAATVKSVLMEVETTKVKADEVKTTKVKADEVDSAKVKADEVENTKVKADEVGLLTPYYIERVLKRVHKRYRSRFTLIHHLYITYIELSKVFSTEPPLKVTLNELGDKALATCEGFNTRQLYMTFYTNTNVDAKNLGLFQRDNITNEVTLLDNLIEPLKDIHLKHLAK